MMGLPFDYGFSLSSMILGWFFMVFFWVLVISAIIWLIKALTTGGQNNNGGQPLEILKQRYARGEITKKEFEEIKKEINK